MPTDPLSIILVLVLLVTSLGVHEAAHAWVALKCGDSTARDLGRITLNPIAHIDLFMTILLPLMLLLSGMPPFGGAKPVPVAFHRLRNPWRDMCLVALAGPLSNFLLAILFGFIYKFVVDVMGMSPGGTGSYQILPKVMSVAVYFNLLLAAFNLIPIPPLDGSRILAWILPEGIRMTYVRFERYGMFIVFGLIIWGGLFRIIGPVMDVMYDWVFNIVELGGLW
ncbi:MAG: Zn-dependent protease [Planctomycetota bacterium]|jgi:Zn-dependent protease